MSREIKFRGIKKETKGEWVRGGYFSNTDEEGLEHFIFEVYYGANPVYGHTIGQFTGLKDKNGVEIYEADIVSYNYFNNAKVVFWQSGWYFETQKDSHHSFNTSKHSFEVIGNIYENPELI
jgi:uncharacterized phage protein (TIGR01671 family)